MGGLFKLKGQQIAPVFVPLLRQKVWSHLECNMLCLQHVQWCLSILIEKITGENSIQCLLYDTRKQPSENKDMYVSISPSSNKTTQLYFLGNKALKPDCQEYKKAGYTEDGEYRIILAGKHTKLFCDMTSRGGYGWIVLQSRTENGTEEWNRNWKSYKRGFGTNPDYWLGNELIHQLTSAQNMRNVRLSVEMDKVLSDGTEVEGWGLYDGFRIANEMEKYAVNQSIKHVSGLGGFER